MWWYAIYLSPLDFLCVGDRYSLPYCCCGWWYCFFLCAFHSGSPILYKKNTMIMMNMVFYMSTKSIAVYKIIDTFFLSKIEKEKILTETVPLQSGLHPLQYWTSYTTEKYSSLWSSSKFVSWIMVVISLHCHYTMPTSALVYRKGICIGTVVVILVLQ